MTRKSELAGLGTGPEAFDVLQIRQHAPALNALTSLAPPLAARRKAVPTSA
ncbi:hypothetical protein [Mycobacterium sp. MMS18-G62]